ncbi:MAG: hypothetical protein ACFE9Z_06705 [Promethearchaeota archaeon]
MSEKKTIRSEINSLQNNEEKILYSDNKIVCFACGEQIDDNIDICPYCKTNLK